MGVIGHNNERLYPYLVNATSRETALAPGGAELRGGCTNASFVYYPTALVAPASCPHVCGAVSFKGVFRGFGSAGGGGGGGEGQPPILRAWAGVVLIMLFTITLDSTGTFFALGKLGGLLDPATLALPPPAEDAAFLLVAASNVLSAGLGMSPSMTFLEVRVRTLYQRLAVCLNALGSHYLRASAPTRSLPLGSSLGGVRA